MAFVENIISVTKDGKLVLNDQALQNISSRASDCDNYALITIIGSKGSGKTLAMNCFHKYIETKDKGHWSHGQIKHGDYFCTDNSCLEKMPHIQMSKPLILEIEGQKTAVFLLDAVNVFEDIKQLKSNILMKNITSLFLFISSTVILLNSGSEQLQVWQTVNDDLGEIVRTMNSQIKLGELFFIYRDWESKRVFHSGKNYLLGSKNGKMFLQNELRLENLQDYFDKIKCFLLPKANIDPAHLNIDLNAINQDYIKQFSNLMKMNLFNSETMALKKLNGKPLKPNSLIDLIQTFIQHLNEQVPIDYNTLSNKLSTEEYQGRKLYFEMTPSPPPPPIFAEEYDISMDDIEFALPPPPVPTTEVLESDAPFPLPPPILEIDENQPQFSSFPPQPPFTTDQINQSEIPPPPPPPAVLPSKTHETPESPPPPKVLSIQLKKTPQINEKTTDPRSELLAAIRGGKKLKSVGDRTQTKLKNNDQDTETTPPKNEAEILVRRVPELPKSKKSVQEELKETLDKRRQPQSDSDSDDDGDKDQWK